MQHHDRHYRQMFQHPAMIRSLLQHLLPAELSGLLALDTLTPIPTDHVGSAGQVRQADLIWQVQRTNTGTALYVLVLLEHQSRPDRWMAVRMAGYVALAYETLIRRRLLPIGQLLPPVLPLVLYSSLKRWRRAVDVASLMADTPPPLRPYQLALHYMLIDMSALARAGTLDDGHLAGALCHLEHNQGLEHATHLLHTMERLTRAPALSELNQAIGLWARHVLLPRAWPEHVPLPDSNSLVEIIDMTTVHHSRDWTLKYRQEGWQEGRQEGRLDGMALILSSQLMQKFGQVPEWATVRLRQADDETLQRWAVNVLSAEQIEAVFD